MSNVTARVFDFTKDFGVFLDAAELELNAVSGGLAKVLRNICRQVSKLIQRCTI